MRRRTRDRRGERGLTLIEVLVSFFILFVVTLAVLQLLSMGYLVNLGSMTRTELMYKAEQVVETIRLQKFRFSLASQTPKTNELTCWPVANNSTRTISPVDPDFATCAPFWGPQGANVIDAGARFSLDYGIDVTGTVTVRAVPLTSGANQYLGPAASKVVVYVAQLY